MFPLHRNLRRRFTTTLLDAVFPISLGRRTAALVSDTYVTLFDSLRHVLFGKDQREMAFDKQDQAQDPAKGVCRDACRPRRLLSHEGRAGRGIIMPQNRFTHYYIARQLAYTLLHTSHQCLKDAKSHWTTRKE